MRSLGWITATLVVSLTALYAVADPYTPSSTPTPTKSEVTPPTKAAPAPTGTTAPKPDKAPAKAKDEAPQNPQPAPVESDWRGRAIKWFKSEDPKARSKEMRAATRALKQPCRYCHTPDFKGYQDNRLISQQMMAMSAEHDVTCADCHAGKKDMTKLGETARKMWDLVHRKKVFCDHCHVPHKRFEALTEAGQAFKAEGQNQD